MHKKIWFFGIFVLLGFMIFSNVWAINNWTQMLTNLWDWWIWSPNKANTDTLPNMIITKDGKVGIGLTNNNTLTNSYYKPWDIIAKRICFEDKAECHSSFAQNLSNNIVFNNTISSEIATEDYEWKIQYWKDILKPIYISVNQDFLNKVGLDPNYWEWEFVWDQATNWFNIGLMNWVAYENVPKSLWTELWAHMASRVITEKWNFIPADNKALYNCSYLNNEWSNISSSSINFCSNPNNNIISHIYCDTSKKHCWILQFELRFTTWNNFGVKTWNQPESCYTENNSLNYMGQWPLSMIIWWNPERLSLYNTQFNSPKTNATYEPSWCRNYPSNMWIWVQWRFVLVRRTNLPAQSLTNYIKGYTPKIKINKIWLTYLR